jgi:hypothetical protein
MTLYGLFDTEYNLIAVHLTEQGAKENKLKYEKQLPYDVFHIDFVVVHN